MFYCCQTGSCLGWQLLAVWLVAQKAVLFSSFFEETASVCVGSVHVCMHMYANVYATVYVTLCGCGRRGLLVLSLLLFLPAVRHFDLYCCVVSNFTYSVFIQG